MTADADTQTDVLRRLYASFNARDLEATLASMQPDVVWANGMEGGHVHGHDGVRAYWTRQWAMINPNVEPISFSAEADGTTIVDVEQIVHDLEGRLLSDTRVVHVFKIEDGLVARFDIR